MKKIFTILSVCALTFASAQTNLITNADLEAWTDATAKPDGWFSMNKESTRESTTVHGGQYSAKLTPYTTTATDGTIRYNNGNLDHPDIAANENTMYTLSYWVLDNDPNTRGRHWIQARTASQNITWSSDFQPGGYSSDAPEWVNVVVTATTPAGTAFLRPSFRVYAQNNIATGSIYYDDFMLVQGTLAVSDVKDFDKQVKMNTLVGDQLTLRLPERSTVNIYSIDGKLVSSNRVSDGDSINTTGLQKGNYIVTVDNGSAKISRKVIKK